jgi:glycosyltransferase involved in cell wall biosynthesis
VLGNGSGYKKKVKAFVAAHDLSDRVIWLNEQTKFAYGDLPVLYQGAKALIYPSIFEGFGIPVLEALWSRTPVITSEGSCFLETAGNAAIYIDPLHPQALAEAMKLIVDNPAHVAGMKEKGWAHAQLFTRDKCAAGVMKVYESL